MQGIHAKPREQITRDCRAEDADFLKHFADTEALRRRFRFGEVLAEEREAVKNRGHEEKSELHLPTHVHAVAENPADETTNDETSGPACMKDVEVVRAVLGKEGGHEWI